MYNDIITFIKKEYAPSITGGKIETITKRDVFARYNSIGMKESYIALANGLKPEISFTIADYYDYNDETMLEYQGREYTILRTYRKKTNELEIVVTSYANA